MATKLAPKSTTDTDIRAVLAKQLRKQHRSKSTVIVEELGLKAGQVIVDIAMVNGAFHGFEIKSDKDSLVRLQNQMTIYNAVFDRMTLVVGETHLASARTMIPKWWGVCCAKVRDGRLQLVELKQSKENSNRDVRVLAELLWRDDAQRLLKKRDAMGGLSAAPRARLWDRLCEVYKHDEISTAVRNTIKARVFSGVLRPLA